MQGELKVRGVTAGYKNFQIRNISFSLAPGEILGLVGRSGAGKSTLIKTLLGINRPLAGSINLGNQERLNQVVGYSAQDHTLFDFLSVIENIELFARLQGQEPTRTAARAEDLLRRFRLYAHQHKRIRDLSGGMRKRADLCVALIHDPTIIILDEPFTGLDSGIKRFIWEKVAELVAEGKSFIISSHLLSELQEHVDKWALVHDKYFYSDKDVHVHFEQSGCEDVASYLTTIFNHEA